MGFDSKNKKILLMRVDAQWKNIYVRSKKKKNFGRPPPRFLHLYAAPIGGRRDAYLQQLRDQSGRFLGR